MNNFLRAIFIATTLFFYFSAYAQPANSKAAKSIKKNEKIKEEQKNKQLRQEEEFKKKHFRKQSKETRQRMKQNEKETDLYYERKRKPLFKRIFPKKYKR